MTVKELINKLKEYPDDTPCVVSGYEGGLSDIEQVYSDKVFLDVHRDDNYYGPHEFIRSTDDYYADYEQTLAIFIGA